MKRSLKLPAVVLVLVLSLLTVTTALAQDEATDIIFLPGGASGIIGGTVPAEGEADQYTVRVGEGQQVHINIGGGPAGGVAARFNATDTDGVLAEAARTAVLGPFAEETVINISVDRDESDFAVEEGITDSYILSVAIPGPGQCVSPFTSGEGSDLDALAERIGTTADVIRELNPREPANDYGNGTLFVYPCEEEEEEEEDPEPDPDPSPEPAPEAGDTYTVQLGDTLYSLARRFGTSVAELQSLNDLGTSTALFAGDVLNVPGSEGAGDDEGEESEDGDEDGTGGSTTTYTVVTGDTLFSLAIRFNTTVSALQAANDLGSSTNIRIGQVLTLPGADDGTGGSTDTYIVEAGDTLFSIAVANGLTVQALQQANNITNPNLISVGQVLTIP